MAIPETTVEAAQEYFKLFEFQYLRVLQSVLADEIRVREKDAIQQAKAEIRKIAEAVGMSVEALLGQKSHKSPSDAAKKVGTTYVDPNNPNRIWHGMGAHPMWFKELLAAGVSKESLRAAA